MVSGLGSVETERDGERGQVGFRLKQGVHNVLFQAFENSKWGTGKEESTIDDTFGENQKGYYQSDSVSHAPLSASP